MVPRPKSVILAGMQVWTGSGSLPQKFQGGAITIGNFDGLHLGHQLLLNSAREHAGTDPVVVITFDPHPLQVLQPEKKLTRIFPRADLSEQLPKYGVDLLVILPFTKELANTSADDFWLKFVSEPFKPKHVIAGHDFAFGHSREGTLNFLREWGAKNACGILVHEPLLFAGEIVSSRKIREWIAKGEMREAAARLGRPFYLRGKVGFGAGRGKSIGVPTLNFVAVNEILPASGVYVTRTLWNGRYLPSVTNIGVNPTFGGVEDIKIETHVIGHVLEVRDRTLDVQFIERLRPEMKFPGIEDLKKQIKDDILKARAVLEKYDSLDVVKPHQ